MLIRREQPGDESTVRAITADAFRKAEGVDPVEALLLDQLRGGPWWVPALSLVAVDADGAVIGHVVCTRATVHTGGGPRPTLGLGPISVRPDRQAAGVGSALVHAALGAADALDEPMMVLLGSPEYYHRFGFELAQPYGVEPPDPGWAPHFQIRPLHAYDPELRGAFEYAQPFKDL